MWSLQTGFTVPTVPGDMKRICSYLFIVLIEIPQLGVHKCHLIFLIIFIGWSEVTGSGGVWWYWWGCGDYDGIYPRQWVVIVDLWCQNQALFLCLFLRLRSCFDINMSSTKIRVRIMNRRRSHNSFIFIMAIPISGKKGFILKRDTGSFVFSFKGCLRCRS